MEDKDSHYIETGFPALDSVLGGGLRCGRSHLMIGRDGMGIDVLANQIATFIALSRSRVLYITNGIVPKPVFFRRAALSYVGVEEGLNFEFTAQSETTRRSIESVVEPLSKYLHYEQWKYTAGWTLQDRLEGSLQKFAEERGPAQLLVLDRVDAIPCEDQERDRPAYLEQLKATFDFAHSVARDHGFALLALATAGHSTAGDKRHVLPHMVYDCPPMSENADAFIGLSAIPGSLPLASEQFLYVEVAESPGWSWEVPIECEMERQRYLPNGDAKRLDRPKRNRAR